MLTNLPPRGTYVRFLRQVDGAPVNGVGTLVKPLAKYLDDHPKDRFEVEFEGRRFIVKRADIVEVERRRWPR